MNMEENIKYEEAFAELQALVHKMENDELDIDQMSEQPNDRLDQSIFFILS